MNIETYAYFETLARHRNVTHAANEIGLTQQALSAQINRLEEFYGIKLFNREDRFSLTYAGERLLDYCRQLERWSTRVNTEMLDLKHGDRGKLTIGATSKRSFVILPIVFDAFHREFPLVQVEVIESNSEKLFENVADGITDFCFVVSETDNPRIASTPIFEERTQLFVTDSLLRKYCQPDYEYIMKHKDEPLSISLFASCPFALQAGNNRIRTDSNRVFAKNNIVPNVIFTTTNSLCILDLTQRGLCAAFLSTSTKAGANNELYRFLIQDLSRISQLKISYLSDNYLSKAATRFIELSKMILPIHFGLASEETYDF